MQSVEIPILTRLLARDFYTHPGDLSDVPMTYELNIQLDASVNSNDPSAPVASYVLPWWETLSPNGVIDNVSIDFGLAHYWSQRGEGEAEYPIRGPASPETSNIEAQDTTRAYRTIFQSRNELIARRAAGFLMLEEAAAQKAARDHDGAEGHAVNGLTALDVESLFRPSEGRPPSPMEIIQNKPVLFSSSGADATEMPPQDILSGPIARKGTYRFNSPQAVKGTRRPLTEMETETEVIGSDVGTRAPNLMHVEADDEGPLNSPLVGRKGTFKFSQPRAAAAGIKAFSPIPPVQTAASLLAETSGGSGNTNPHTSHSRRGTFRFNNPKTANLPPPIVNSPTPTRKGKYKFMHLVTAESTDTVIKPGGQEVLNTEKTARKGTYRFHASTAAAAVQSVVNPPVLTRKGTYHFHASSSILPNSILSQIVTSLSANPKGTYSPDAPVAAAAGILPIISPASGDPPASVRKGSYHFTPAVVSAPSETTIRDIVDVPSAPAKAPPAARKGTFRFNAPAAAAAPTRLMNEFDDDGNNVGGVLGFLPTTDQRHQLESVARKGTFPFRSNTAAADMDEEDDTAEDEYVSRDEEEGSGNDSEDEATSSEQYQGVAGRVQERPHGPYTPASFEHYAHPPFD